ncbi:hypothetical protein BH23PAT1_BH23PAT1_5010 [soil metagenome]
MSFMKTPRYKVAEIIAERTMHLRDDSQLAQAVAAYLLAENRTAELESIMRDVRSYRTERGFVEATAVSAHELDKAVRKDIESVMWSAFPNAKAVNVQNVLDPTVIGGVRVEMANKQLDLTIRSKLNTFKRLTAAVKE